MIAITIEVSCSGNLLTPPTPKKTLYLLFSFVNIVSVWISFYLFLFWHDFLIRIDTPGYTLIAVILLQVSHTHTTERRKQSTSIWQSTSSWNIHQNITLLVIVLPCGKENTTVLRKYNVSITLSLFYINVFKS